MEFIHKYLQTNIMNRIMFYNKLDKYHLAHATDEWGKQYYNKLDNYYSNGKARYFYTKEEWDAYQREQQGKAQDNFKKQQEAKKTAEAKNNMSGYSDWKKGQEQKEAAKVSQQNKLNDINNEEKNKQAEIYNKNKNAADAEDDRQEYKVSRENEWGRRKAIQRTAQKNLEKNRLIRKNKAAAEAEGEREQAKIEAQKKADEIQRDKYIGKKNLEKKLAEDKWKRQQEEAKKRVEEREQRAELAKKNQEAREAATNKSRDTFRELVKKQERDELAKKNQEAQEAAMKKSQDLAREESVKREAVNNYKEKSSTELDQQNTAINNLLDQCYSKRNVPFNIDNELVEELKTQIALKDPEFVTRWNSDIGKYVQPWVDSNIMFWDGDKDDEHYKIAKETLNEISTKYKNDIDNTKYDDIPENNQTYLEKKKEDYDRKIESDIGQDIAKAKLSLIKVHQGDSKNFEIDPSLKKILENKLEQIDDKYDGDLYDYIKPYFGLSFLPDNASYQNIEDILNEMEEELKSGKNPYGIYTEYYNNIRNAVYNA